MLNYHPRPYHGVIAWLVYAKLPRKAGRISTMGTISAYVGCFPAITSRCSGRISPMIDAPLGNCAMRSSRVINVDSGHGSELNERMKSCVFFVECSQIPRDS